MVVGVERHFGDLRVLDLPENFGQQGIQMQLLQKRQGDAGLTGRVALREGDSPYDEVVY